jgi:hypothetical protein
VFARFIGTNYRNGSPMKKIWVPKSCLEKLPMNVIMTPPGKKTNPRSKAPYGPKPHTDIGPHKVTLMAMFCRETIIRLMNMSVFLQTAMFTNQRIFCIFF